MRRFMKVMPTFWANLLEIITRDSFFGFFCCCFLFGAIKILSSSSGPGRHPKRNEWSWKRRWGYLQSDWLSKLLIFFVQTTPHCEISQIETIQFLLRIEYALSKVKDFFQQIKKSLSFVSCNFLKCLISKFHLVKE